MFVPDAPPLPSAAPLTAAAADRWRAARGVWRLDSRWLALLPLAFTAFATAVEPSGTHCNTYGVCRNTWGDDLGAWSVLAETILLAAKVRVRALIPPAVLAVLWYTPDGLVTTAGRWTAVLVHVLLATVLIRAELGRHRARQQLDELMAPPVPFPWTAAGGPSPVDPGRPPVVRRVLGGLLLAVALAIPLHGLWQEAGDADHRARATTVTGTAGTTDQDGVLTVRYRPRDGGPERTVDLDATWARQPRPGERVPLLVDGDWAGAVGDEYDVLDDVSGAGLIALPGLLLLASASKASARLRRPPFAGSAPALAVRVRVDAKGDLLVQPFDGPSDGPAIWRLVERDRYRWARHGAPDGTGPGWVPEWLETGADDGDDFLHPHPVFDDHEDHEDRADDETEDPAHQTLPPAVAAARLAHAGQTVDAVLYHGPDGPERQLLVRPGLLERDPRWLAAVVAPAARAPRAGRDGQRYHERALAVAALTAETVAAAPEPGPDARPVPARRWETPLGLRAAAGPVSAVLLVAVVLLGGDGWWDGLVRPLWIGSIAILACGRTLSWQLVADRDGLRVATALRGRSFRWQEINAAAVHRNLLTIQLRSGEEITVGSRPAAWLAGHFGDHYDPAELARTVATAAHRPDLRPTQPLPDRLGSPQHALNRLSLAGFAAFTVVHHLL
ncbi:hypothetical protein F7Q99_09515 [Streptomyces kaniharaensis]|uniref:PH domain-containing protein n=1 Tax=Streptomyces kaniharaensis TaxID=212423 RepID=A0A6N7KLZ5_9ACTN|nr:hypothetical protein [Streptomyces kaniharaensis]MQS12516.1 hypothetical protein [Streptomyces kaniharaensis]